MGSASSRVFTPLVSHEQVFARLQKIFEKFKNILTGDSLRLFHEFILEIAEVGVTLGNGHRFDDGEMMCNRPDCTWVQLSSNDQSKWGRISPENMTKIINALNEKFPRIRAELSRQDENVILLNNQVLFHQLLPAFHQHLPSKLAKMHQSRVLGWNHPLQPLSLSSTAAMSTSLAPSSISIQISYEMVYSKLQYMIRKADGGPVLGMCFFFQYILDQAGLGLRLGKEHRFYRVPTVSYSRMELSFIDGDLTSDHLEKLARALNNKFEGLAIEVGLHSGILLNNTHLLKFVESDDFLDYLKLQYSAKTIDLPNMDIGDSGAKELAKLLRNNKTLLELYLRANRINDKGAEAIAEALKVNDTLCNLGLAHNQIGNEGAKAIAEALKVNNAIKKLDFSLNYIGPEARRAIAEVLKQNHTLEELYLDNCSIGNDGAEKIAEALEENKSLCELDLSRNDITDDGAKAIAAALKDNATLRKLNLVGNKIDPAILNEIETYLERNCRCSRVKGIAI